MGAARISWILVIGVGVPAYTPPLPPPDNFALDNVIGDRTTLCAVAYSSDPAQHGLVLAPVGPTSLMYIAVLTVFEEDVMQGQKDRTRTIL